MTCGVGKPFDRKTFTAQLDKLGVDSPLCNNTAAVRAYLFQIFGQTGLHYGSGNIPSGAEYARVPVAWEETLISSLGQPDVDYAAMHTDQLLQPSAKYIPYARCGKFVYESKETGIVNPPAYANLPSPFPSFREYTKTTTTSK